LQWLWVFAAKGVFENKGGKNNEKWDDIVSDGDN
jgi:hypothetical protein